MSTKNLSNKCYTKSTMADFKINNKKDMFKTAFIEGGI